MVLNEVTDMHGQLSTIWTVFIFLEMNGMSASSIGLTSCLFVSLTFLGWCLLEMRCSTCCLNDV